MLKHQGDAGLPSEVIADIGITLGKKFVTKCLARKDFVPELMI
jgi:hypothetical protein